VGAGGRLEALYVMALTLGLRRGELLGLRWSDIDLKAGSVRVVRSLQRVSGRTEFVEPKSARSRREVSFPAFVGDVLGMHRKRQIKERLRAGDAWVDSDLVFTTGEGRPLDGMNLTPTSSGS
jgi:integrase